ncbi:hypothetical protein [Providencia sp. PROV202]|uniref:hypothetical protein n=1 Tax=Providencia sp. PROV202 TaxID=2949902 RepID=UPI00234A89D5|nr:hypothetical protein [Providencia sp. PROV202]
MKLNNNFSTDFQHEIDNKSAIYQSYKADKSYPLLSGKRLMWAAMVMNMAILHSAQATELTVYIGSGSTFWSNASRSITGNHIASTDSTGPNGWAFRWNLVPDTNISSGCGSSSYGFVDITSLGIPPKVGMKIADGIILYFTQGNLKSSLTVTVPQRPEATASLSADGTMSNLTNSSAGYNQRLCASLPSNTAVRDNATVNTSLTNGKLAVYVDKSAKSGTYNIPAIYLVSDTKYALSGLVAAGGTLTVKYPPLSCSVSAPPKIDFGKVNIWEWEGNTSGTPGGNRKDILGSVDGNFTINCTADGDSYAPAKLTLKGDVQEYANDLKMTMDATGELAPATVRASIKSIIAPCESGGTSFGTGGKTPPSNEVNLGELTVGQNLIPYRFSLCALGQGFKSGAASASATVTIDWE